MGTRQHDEVRELCLSPHRRHAERSYVVAYLRRVARRAMQASQSRQSRLGEFRDRHHLIPAGVSFVLGCLGVTCTVRFGVCICLSVILTFKMSIIIIHCTGTAP